MGKQPIFGSEDLRHPNHTGPNPFADAGGTGAVDSNPLASSASASDYEPTGYTAALAPRGRRLMIMASTGTLFAVLCAVSMLLSFFGLLGIITLPLYIGVLITPALTLPAIMMATQDLRAMRAGAMDPTDQKLTTRARRVAAIGLAVSTVACAQLIRWMGLTIWSL